MYTYKATLDRVIDGDTIDVNIDLGFHIWIHSKRIRLHHVDTPEKRTRDLLEKHFGFLATDYVIKKMVFSEKIVITTTIDGHKDKYGRILGEIWIDDDSKSINDQLIEMHYAVEYKGQDKSLIEEEHINNYKYLVVNNLTVLSETNQLLFEQLL